MKKRVRIYGAGGSTSTSMNKATPWRAQEGGTQQQQPQYTDEQLVSTVMTIIGEQGGTPEDALNQLVQAGVDQAKANQVVSSAVSYLNDHMQMNNAQMTDQGYEANKLAEEDAALEQQAQDDQEYAARQQRYQQMMASNDEDTTDYGDDQDVVSSMMAKFGGAMPSKRSFVKNVMKLTKKQMGGDGTSNKADDTDTGERKGGLSDFIIGLQGHANDALMKQDAEALYDQYQDMGTDADYGYDMDQDYMQFGGGMRPGQMRRMNRRANRMMGQMPAGMFNNRAQMFPSQMNIMGMGMPMMGPQGFSMPGQGSYQGGPQLANIDVRRTGLFGRPKEYTVTFAQEAYTNPQLRQDVIKQEQNNQQQKAKEIWTEVKEEVDNTATEKNAEVKAEAAKSPTTATSESVDAEVSASTGRPRNTGTAPTVNPVDEVVEEEGVESATIPGISSVAPNAISGKTVIGDIIGNYHNAQKGAPKEKDVTWQYLEGKPYQYTRTDGKWYYDKPVYNEDGSIYTYNQEPQLVTNQQTLNRLTQGELSGKGSKKNVLYRIDEKPGYYYRETNAGDYVKFKGDPKKHDYNSKPISTIKKGDKNYEYLQSKIKYAEDIRGDKMLRPKTTSAKGNKATVDSKAAVNDTDIFNLLNADNYQFGGMTMEDSGLYKFVYGGNDPISTPFEENTADPYFQMGGYYQDGGGHWSNGEWVEGIDPRDADELKGNLTTNLSNRDSYEKAKAAGVNVGEYRDGIKYEDLHKFPKMVNSGSPQRDNFIPRPGEPGYNTNLPYNNPYMGNMYNPQVGAMYPPLFGGRRQFGPSGRTIEYAGSWAQQQGMAFDPRTGKPVNPAMMGNQPLSKIDVTKSSLFGKRPKEYTMYFGDYGQNAGAKPAAGTASTPQEDNESRFGDGSGREKVANALMHVPGLRKIGAKLFPHNNNLTNADFENPATTQTPSTSPTTNNSTPQNFNISPNTTGDYADVMNQQRGPMEGAMPARGTTQSTENSVGSLPTKSMENVSSSSLENDIVNQDLATVASSEEEMLNQYPLSPQEQAFVDMGIPVSEFRNTDFLDEQEADAYATQKEQEFNNSLPLNAFTGTGPVTEEQYMAATGNNSYYPANPYGYQDQNLNQEQDFLLDQMRMNNPDMLNMAPYNNPMDIDSFYPAENTPVSNPIVNNNRNRNNNRGVTPAKRNNSRPIQQREAQASKKKEYNKTLEGNAYSQLIGMRDAAAGNNPKAFRKAAQPIDASGKKIFQRMTHSEKLNYLNKLKKMDRNLYESYLTLLQKGGTLPQAQNGTVGISDVEPMAELKPRAYQDVWESVEPEVRKSWGLEEKEPEIEKGNSGYAAKFKNKNMYNVDFERAVNQFNTAANWGVQKLGEVGQRGITRDFYDNLTADNLYGSTNLEDRGTYDTNSGLFRPDDMGFKGIIRNGGFLQDGGYAEPVYDQDEEAYMTQDEIDQFLADGGELEYL